MKKKKLSYLLTSGLIATSLCLAACNSSKTDSEGDNGADGTFVADETTVGSIKVIVNDPIPTGQTGTFRVEVRDASGGPVRNTRITCNTEGALTLTEPTSGNAITDDFGDLSGTVGCNAPGSFQLGCRLPIGANRRDFELVQCDGEIPSGFGGFPGGGSGGLGGGVVQDDQTITEGANLRITNITFSEAGQDGTVTLDTSFDLDCDNMPETVDPEPFTETRANITVTSTSEVSPNKLVGYSITVRDASGNRIHSSPRLGASADFSGESSQFNVLFAFLDGGSTRTYVGDFGPVTEGNMTVSIRLFFEDQTGEERSISGSATFEVRGANRC